MLPGEVITKAWADTDLWRRNRHTGTAAVDSANRRNGVPYDLHLIPLMAGSRLELRLQGGSFIVEDGQGQTVIAVTTAAVLIPSASGLYRILILEGTSGYTLDLSSQFRTTLRSNEFLGVGEFLKSENGIFTGRMEADGRFSISKYESRAWVSSAAAQTADYRATLQDDGNFVVRREGADGAILFASGVSPGLHETAWQSGVRTWRLTLTNAGNLVIAWESPDGSVQPVWFSPARNVAETRADYPRQLPGPFELSASSQQALRSAPRALTIAAQAALRSVYDYLDDIPDQQVIHKEEVRRFGTDSEPGFPDPGLGPSARVSFHRKVGPREMTFLVASNETDVVIAIRGTETLTNWNLNGIPFNKATPEDAFGPNGPLVTDGYSTFWLSAQFDCLWNALPIQSDRFPGLLVHQGWEAATDSIFSRVTEELREHHARGKSITVTGHSLGGAVTGYLTYRLLNETDYFDPQKSHLMATFAAPHYALDFQEGAAAVAACKFALDVTHLPGDCVTSIAQFVQEIRSDFESWRLDRIPGAIARIEQQYHDRFTFRNNNPQQGSFHDRFHELISQKAPQMTTISVEARHGEQVDLITAAWSLKGWGEQIMATVKAPLDALRQLGRIQIVPDSVPHIISDTFGIPRQIELFNNDILSVIGPLVQLGQQGFGTAVRLGTPIDLPSHEPPVFDLHGSTNYLNLLEVFGQTKAASERA